MRCGHCKATDVDIAHVRGHLAKPEPVAKPAPATVGMYRKGGQIYRVDWTSAGHLFAKLARIVQAGDGQTRVSYVPAKGMVAKLSQADRMDADEVAAFGKLTMVCMRCGIRLEVPESVERGIGPVCATKI